MNRVLFTVMFSATTLISASSAKAEYNKNSVPALASAMVTTCGLGNVAISAGSTPTAIAGVTIVSAQQAKCLIDRYSQSLLVIGAMRDLEQLPNAFPVPTLGYDKADAEFDKRIAADFVPLTGGRKDRPILIYCHHASCQFSANGSEHLVRMGYTRIFWLRDGTKGWRQAGYKFADTPRAALPTASASTAQSTGVPLTARRAVNAFWFCFYLKSKWTDGETIAFRSDIHKGTFEVGPEGAAPLRDAFNTYIKANVPELLDGRMWSKEVRCFWDSDRSGLVRKRLQETSIGALPTVTQAGQYDDKRINRIVEVNGFWRHAPAVP